MSLDLGSPAIEIAIALSFVFFLLSLIVTALTEVVSWATRQRSEQLVKGIEGLLGQETLSGQTEQVSEQVLAHPLVQSDNTTPAREKRPSYLSARDFARALTDTVREWHGVAGRSYGELKGAVEALPADSVLGKQLRALLPEAESSVAEYRKAIEDWFDDAMDRVSGWYKRWSQWITIGFAVLLTLTLNASAVRIVERFAEEPAVRTAVVQQAEAAARANQPGVAKTPQEAGDKVSTAYDDLEALKLPLMWSGENVPSGVKSWIVAAIGWALTAAAISLGAPFWFDTLGRLSRLRTTGKRPEGEAGPQT